MRCPYQTKTVHKTEDDEHYASDLILFGQCLEKQCPFYYQTDLSEHCRRAENESRSK